MRGESVTTDTFALDGATAASVSYDDNTFTATLTPNVPLTPDRPYTTTISGDVRDLAGNQMQIARTWSFTTAPPAVDTMAPSVAALEPPAQATDVPADTAIAVRFDEALDVSTLPDKALKVEGIAGACHYDADSRRLVFLPTANLAAGTTYTAVLASGIRDLSGNATASAVSWTFTTIGAAPQADWAILVYMAGDNNLSDGAVADLNEMESVGSGDRVTILAQVEFSPVYSPGLPTDTMRMIVHRDDDLGAVDFSGATHIGNVDMASPEALTDFIRWAVNKGPAKQYALVIWDHGAGWRGGGILPARGAIQDETSDSFMTLPEIREGIAGGGVHFNIINVDACLMAMYEVAYELREVTDYLVFSEETEPGEGNPYDTILAKLASTPSMTSRLVASMIVAEYRKYYSTHPRGGTTISAFDMSGLAAIDAQIVALATTLRGDSATTSIVTAATASTQNYAVAANHDLYDLASYLSTTLTSSPARTAAAGLLPLIQAAVVANETTGTGLERSHGLAIYLPGKFDTNSTDLAEYKMLACNEARGDGKSTWGDFVDTYIASVGGGQVEYGPGEFGFLLGWTTPSGDSCDADLDLYVWEPGPDYAVSGDGDYHAAWMGQRTPNGYFSPDSGATGESQEYYIAGPAVCRGSYVVIANYYADGSHCAGANAHLYYKASRESEWEELADIPRPSPQELNLSDPAPQDCADVACLDEHSNWWFAFSIERSASAGATVTPLSDVELAAKLHRIIAQRKKSGLPPALRSL